MPALASIGNTRMSQSSASPQTSKVRETLGRAVTCQQQGRLRDAERLCREVLAVKPGDHDAQHLLGLLCHQQGRSGEAIELLGALIARRADAPALSNYGLVLQDLKRHGEALASYDQALKLKPDFADALNNRGTALIELGRHGEAVASFDRAIAIRPRYAGALVNRAMALGALGRHAEAVAGYDRAAAVAPLGAEALSRRSAALVALKRYAEAVAGYDRVLAIMPDLPDVHNNRATALIELGRAADALAGCDRALALDPNYVEAHYNRGAALSDLKRFNEAVASYDRALALKPDHVEAHNNRGIALDELGRHEDALASYTQALTLNPDYAEAHNNRGTCLIDLGRCDEALASYDAALALNAGYVECCWNRSLLLLRLGRFAEGWRDYEWRRKRDAWEPQTFAGPEWTGEAAAGKRLLFYSEQGLGDTIQFARFAGTVAAAGAEVVVQVQPPLRRLIGSLGGVTVIGKGDRLPAVDAHLPLMSLPNVLGTIPVGGYLAAEPERVRAWSKRLPRGTFNVGIVWQGNPNAKCESGRSIPLRAFAPLAAVPGVRLVSLQKNEGAEQLRDLPSGMAVETLGKAFDAGPDAFLDSAAVLMNLDLVITSDTAMAHLAGALGRPVWIALQHVPDWRWMLERKDTPWYPTARLFRQSRSGDWDSLFARIAAELTRLVGQSPVRALEQAQP